MVEVHDFSYKAFISYSHLDREYGQQVRDVLNEVEIEAFLAHEDIEVSEEWRERIIEELNNCLLFVPLLSENFLKSKWASQEIGFVISRSDVVIAPLSIDGTTSFGFISYIQSRRIPVSGITRELLVKPLTRKAPRIFIPKLIQVVKNADTFRSAEARMLPLVKHFSALTPDEAQALAEASVQNDQIWQERKCRNRYLPIFIRIQKDNIHEATLKALEYQLRHQERYIGEHEA